MSCPPSPLNTSSVFAGSFRTETISLTARSSVPDGIQRTESLRVYVRATFHEPGGTFVKNFGEVIP